MEEANIDSARIKPRAKKTKQDERKRAGQQCPTYGLVCVRRRLRLVPLCCRVYRSVALANSGQGKSTGKVGEPGKPEDGESHIIDRLCNITGRAGVGVAHAPSAQVARYRVPKKREENQIKIRSFCLSVGPSSCVSCRAVFCSWRSSCRGWRCRLSVALPTRLPRHETSTFSRVSVPVYMRRRRMRDSPSPDTLRVQPIACSPSKPSPTCRGSSPSTGLHWACEVYFHVHATLSPPCTLQYPGKITIRKRDTRTCAGISQMYAI